MPGREIIVQTGDGDMPVELFGDGVSSPLPQPAVILFMDAPGIRDELREAAARIAGAGFICALPDLYYRIGRIRLYLTRRSDTHAAIYRLLGDSLDNGATGRDTGALVKTLMELPGVAPGQMGAVGFSIGARFALQAPGLFPGRFAAVATICGTHLVTGQSDSPHLAFAEAPTPLAVALDFAEDDPAVSAETPDTLRQIIEARGFDGSIVHYPGTRHGYSFALRPMYDPQAAEGSWRRVLNVLAKIGR